MKFVLAATVLALATPALAQHGEHAGHGAHAAHAAPAATVQGTGVLKSIDARAGTVTIAHDPIKALNWGAMTMPFKVADPALLKAAASGDKVTFQLKGQQIVALSKR
ncbi:copper-binding protein [Phenylobacterium sp. J367]|uniref:copper-binding protein n=1 Tax=Phenylobacterium sp. J367 TaxID=2898435 RepID=UPI0021518D52|nr:copper-binding protein [Phenylobacterium sp. J367]MCR5879306.1 copper-binding protein [Phenylobacterium sp. J367]